MSQHPLFTRFMNRGPVLLIVLDGWGTGKGDEGDAIGQAATPTFSMLARDFAHTTLLTHGPHVGLPTLNDIGGSEVGHLTMGAGKIIQQGASRIKSQMESGEFFRGEVLQGIMKHCLERDTPLHLLGLLSDGNVHSHISHFHGIIDHAETQGIRRLYVHALLDGRDVPYQSALEYVQPLEAKFSAINDRHPGWEYAIASGGGREVITMDRDLVWEKVRKGWETHVLGMADHQFNSATEAIQSFRSLMPDESDQNLPSFVVLKNGNPIGPIRDGHALIFMNFRGDRAIEFSQAMVQEDFHGFERQGRPDIFYAGMSMYDEDTGLPPFRLNAPPEVKNPIGRRIVELGLRQFRLAETQKYAHVTFFFNGGYREPLDKALETYCLISSDKINSFARAPKMKAREIAQKACEFIRDGSYRFGLINFANADMVGHTGDLAAAIQGVEAVDGALADILQVLREKNGLAIITADHGNADEMITFNPKTGKREPNTRHSVNPVPVYLFDPQYKGTADYRLKTNDPAHPNTLANIAATIFTLMGQPVPKDLDSSLFLES